MKNSPDKKAFTIMEILIVVIIVGIIAAFAIPNYGRSVRQSHLQDAMMQLSAIRNANQIYFARTSSYWPSTPGQGVTEINANLSLNIIENQITYTCGPGATAGITFTCTAVYNDPVNTFTATLTEAPLATNNPPVATDNPRCTSGDCT